MDSPLASEGTRTGFYTDDAGEQDFKPPEEIRKADLRGADLRFARVLDTDFYLVDLRGAKYTLEQGEHFARTGAILQDRAR
ncbi:MAG: pentapeptide repeat-containing protein [Planctomycetes bacterium]|nr:pentapeptide repeat-containing protein [Planctomycetota bacterium]